MSSAKRCAVKCARSRDIKEVELLVFQRESRFRSNVNYYTDNYYTGNDFTAKVMLLRTRYPFSIFGIFYIRLNGL